MYQSPVWDTLKPLQPSYFLLEAHCVSSIPQLMTTRPWSGTSSRCPGPSKTPSWPTLLKGRSTMCSGPPHSRTGSPSATTTAWRSCVSEATDTWRWRWSVVSDLDYILQSSSHCFQDKDEVMSELCERVWSISHRLHNSLVYTFVHVFRPDLLLKCV